MGPGEIRAIRGSLSRAAFARLLGVTPLTVLRWELPDGNKEARRPRAKLIDAIRRLADERIGSALGADGQQDDDDIDADASEPVNVAPAAEAKTSPASLASDEDKATLHPILDRLGTESWPSAENQLLGLLASGSLRTHEGRQLAALGIVQAQIFGRLDLCGAVTTLLPILAEAEHGRLPHSVEARAHVLATLLFSSMDARFFDPGRVNVHVARAQAVLDATVPAVDDLRVYLATGAIAAARFLGPSVLMRTFQAHELALARASSPLATILVEAIRHIVKLGCEDHSAAALHAHPYIALVERLRMPYVYIAIFAYLTLRITKVSATPEEIIGLVRDALARVQAAGITTTEELLRLYACEMEAHTRLGHFADAEGVYRTAMAAARRHSLPTYPLVAAASHFFTLLNRRTDLEVLADEVETEGAPRAGPNHHALHARAAALFASGDTEGAIALAERICSAPKTAAGIDDLCHQAHYGLVVMRLAQNDTPKARGAIQRFEMLLEERPSVWFSVVLRRLDGFVLFCEGRLAEARQKLESVLPAFRLLGEVTELAVAEPNLAVVARELGAPDAKDRVAEAARNLAALGVADAIVFQRVARARMQPAVWSEQTLCERLVIALDRLSLRGLRADQLRREIGSIVGDLFPGHAVCVAPVAQDATSRDGVDVPDGVGGLLRVSVDGKLSAEQHAALRLFGALVQVRAAARAPREAEPVTDPILPNFIAASPAARRLKREIEQLSQSNATILITGESGSGKEVVARGLHDLSSRAGKPYVVFNCASVPRDLFEGQLFGYKNGAFTGATGDNLGVIRAAEGGTLFLDEIAELPLDTQPKLLRFLENGEIFVLGEQKPRHVDVRVLAATHRDLGRFVREGLFREDLYYRLNVVPLSVPPLRERVEDVVPLARMFIERLAPEGQERPELSLDAIAALEGYTWPGNVRELRNAIERAMAYAPIPSVLRAERLRIGRR